MAYALITLLCLCLLDSTKAWSDTEEDLQGHVLSKLRPMAPQSTGIFIQPWQRSYDVIVNKEFFLGSPLWVDGDLATGCPRLRADLKLSYTSGALYFWPGHQSSSYNDGSASLQMTGSLDQINWAMSNLKYVPNTDYIGPEVVKVVVAAGDVSCTFTEKANATITLNVKKGPITDAVLTLLGFNATQTVNLRTQENQKVTLNFDLRMPGVPAGDLMDLNISVIRGTLDFPRSSLTANLIWLANGPSSYVVRATASDILQYVLTELAFTPPPYATSDPQRLGFAPPQISVLHLQVGDGPSATGTNMFTAYFNISSDPTTCPCFVIGDLNITEDFGQVPWPIVLIDPEYNEVDQMSLWLTVRLTLSSGSFWFPSTMASLVYNEVNKSYTFFGTESAIKRALNGTLFTPTPDFAGTVTLEVYVQDHTVTDGSLALVRNHTIYAYASIIPINDPPRLRGSDQMYHLNRNETLVFTNVQAWDPDANPASDVMQITIQTYGGQVNLSRSPLSAGIIAVNGNWQPIQTSISFNATLGQLNNLLNGMRYKSTKPWADYIDHIVDPVDAIDFIKITINDNGASGLGGPKTAILYLNITAYADLFPTCQSFVNMHPQYCGCYYVTEPVGVPVNAAGVLYAALPMDFPMRLYLSETSYRVFAQGCCRDYLPAERPVYLTRRNQVGTCAKTVSVGLA